MIDESTMLDCFLMEALNRSQRKVMGQLHRLQIWLVVKISRNSCQIKTVTRTIPCQKKIVTCTKTCQIKSVTVPKLIRYKAGNCRTRRFSGDFYRSCMDFDEYKYIFIRGRPINQLTSHNAVIFHTVI